MTNERGIKMGILVMIFGESGSGKSTSLHNFKAGEVSVINVSKKPLSLIAAGGIVNMPLPAQNTK